VNISLKLAYLESLVAQVDADLILNASLLHQGVQQAHILMDALPPMDPEFEKIALEYQQVSANIELIQSDLSRLSKT
jgi:hypothetical protein